MNKKNFFITTLLLFVMALQMVLSSLSDSPYNDEQVHILAGLTYLNYKDLRTNPEHPPLAKLLSAASLKLFYRDLHFPYPREKYDQFNWLQPIADELFSKNNPDKLHLTARFPLIILSLFFAGIIFLLVRKITGFLPAVIMLSLVSFEPNILAFGKGVVTDNAVAGFLAVSFLMLYFFLSSFKIKYWFFFSFFFFLALISKHTSLFFIPILFLSSIFYLVIAKKTIKKLAHFSLMFVLSILFCYLSLWCFYSLFSPPSFFYHLMPDYAKLYDQVRPQWIIQLLRKNFLPYYYSYGLSYNLALGFFGQKAFLLNKWGPHNWWWFYPVTFFLKTPLIYLGFFVFSIFSLRKNKATVFFATIFFLYLAYVCFSPLAIGIRVILPLTYIMLIIIGISLNSVLKSKKYNPYLISIIFITAFLRLSSFPNYLSHINGVKIFFNKYDMMADTNYDWGQDIKRLAKYFKDKGITSIYFSSDAAVKPSLYQLKTKPIPYDFENPKPKGWVALSVSARNFPVNVRDESGREGGYEHPYSWLDRYPIYQTIGETILIYYLL